MENLIVFMASFLLIFIFYFIVYLVKYKKGSIKEIKEIKFLRYISKSSLKGINLKRLWWLYALLNAFIISVSGTVCTCLNIGYVWQMLTGFGLLFIMIYLVYGILGKILKRRVNRK